MPKAISRIQHRPLADADQKRKEQTRTFNPGDDVPEDIAKDLPPGTVETSRRPAVATRDVTSDEAVRRSITHAPDHPDRPAHIPGVDEWKVTRTGAFAAPVTKPEDTAAAKTELRKDVPDKGKPATLPAPPKK